MAEDGAGPGAEEMAGPASWASPGGDCFYAEEEDGDGAAATTAAGTPAEATATAPTLADHAAKADVEAEEWYAGGQTYSALMQEAFATLPQPSAPAAAAGEGLRVVELGCGAGGKLAIARELLGAREIVGVELNPKAVQLCREASIPVMHAEPGDYSYSPADVRRAAALTDDAEVDDSKFDVVLMAATFTHIPYTDYADWFALLKRLAGGGAVMFIEPCPADEANADDHRELVTPDAARTISETGSEQLLQHLYPFKAYGWTFYLARFTEVCKAFLGAEPIWEKHIQYKSQTPGSAMDHDVSALFALPTE